MDLHPLELPPHHDDAPVAPAKMKARSDTEPPPDDPARSAATGPGPGPRLVAVQPVDGTLSSLAVTAIALGWLAMVIAIDVVVGQTLVLTGALAIASVIAALGLSPKRTTVVTLAAVAAAVLLGIPHIGIPGPGLTNLQHAFNVGVVALIGLLAIWVSELRVRLQRALEIARRRANHDPLTGTLTRRAVYEHGEQLAALRPENRPPLSLLMVDVDHFKTVNDTFGHPAGDEVLRRLARRLGSTLRDADLLARYGGEEFLILLVGGGLAEAHTVAQRCLELVRGTPVPTSEFEIDVTISIGIAEVAPGERSLAGALRRADTALYDSKRAGRDRATAHPEVVSEIAV